MSNPIRLSLFEMLALLQPRHVDAGQAADAADILRTMDEDLIDYDNCEWIAPPRGYMGEDA